MCIRDRRLIDSSVEQYESSDPDAHQHAEARFRRAQILAAANEPEAARRDAQVALEIYERFDDQPTRKEAVQTWLRSGGP